MSAPLAHDETLKTDTRHILAILLDSRDTLVDEGTEVKEDDSEVPRHIIKQPLELLDLLDALEK